VDARAVLRALAVGRIAIGAGLVLAPRLAAGGWIGSDAARPGTTVLARALGARDALIGLMLLHTLDRPEVAQRWVKACAAIDGIDAAAMLAVRRDLPSLGGNLGLVVAAGSSATHAALASQVAEPAVSATSAAPSA
jgi:hypothetical protein